jgi:hypothetical protein
MNRRRATRRRRAARKQADLKLWLMTSALFGATAGFAAHLFGRGPLRAEAPLVALVAGLLLLGLSGLRLRAPDDLASRRNALLTKRSKPAVLVILGLSSVAGVTWATYEGLRGYDPMVPETILGEAPPDVGGFYLARGTPVLGALYHTRGSEGERFLFPLEGYEGRLLVLSTVEPPDTTVQVTGKLRDTFQGRQSAPDGTPEGPFLPLYRKHVRLPDTAQVYFLDTSIRAGMNTRTLVLALLPLYLLLLSIGAPVRVGEDESVLPR